MANIIQNPNHWIGVILKLMNLSNLRLVITKFSEIMQIIKLVIDKLDLSYYDYTNQYEKPLRKRSRL